MSLSGKLKASASHSMLNSRSIFVLLLIVDTEIQRPVLSTSVRYSTTISTLTNYGLGYNPFTILLPKKRFYYELFSLPPHGR